MNAFEIADELNSAGVEVQGVEAPATPYGTPTGPAVALVRLRGGACVHVPGSGRPYVSRPGRTALFRSIGPERATLAELVDDCRHGWGA
jgi:hypothetical protein